MAALPRMTTFGWVPEFARGFVRDLRVRWAFEEVGQAYAVDYIHDAKAPAHRRFQPFGQVPAYRDDDVEIFESGAIILRIAERAEQLIPHDPGRRMKAVQWMFAALNTIEPAIMGFTVNHVFEADRPWSADRRPVVLASLDMRLRDLQADLGDRQWLDGDAFTVGDLTMISSLGGLRGTGVMDRLPGLAAYVGRGEARPAYRKAMADHLAVFDAVDAA